MLSWNIIMMTYECYKVAKLGVKCGFSIGQNSLGYGVVIPHYGTIAINSETRIGNYAVITPVPVWLVAIRLLAMASTFLQEVRW